MTRASFENAIVTVMALGGSTNAVLHLIAMARAFDIELTIDDFQTVSHEWRWCCLSVMPYLCVGKCFSLCGRIMGSSW